MLFQELECVMTCSGFGLGMEWKAGTWVTMYTPLEWRVVLSHTNSWSCRMSAILLPGGGWGGLGEQLGASAYCTTASNTS